MSALLSTMLRSWDSIWEITAVRLRSRMRSMVPTAAVLASRSARTTIASTILFICLWMGRLFSDIKAS